MALRKLPVARARRDRAAVLASVSMLGSAGLFSTAFWLPIASGPVALAVVVSGIALGWLAVGLATIGGR